MSSPRAHYMINASKTVEMSDAVSAAPNPHDVKSTDFLSIVHCDKDGKPLSENEQRLRSIIDHNVDAVFAFDIHGLLVSANAACTTVTGFTSEELGEMRLPQLVIRSHVRVATEMFEAALTGSAQTFELELIHKTGNAVSVVVTNIPIFVNGKVDGIYGVAKDISERKHIESSIRASENKYRQLTEQSIDAIFLLDTAGKLLDVNSQSCASLGYQAEELLQLYIEDLIDPDDLRMRPLQADLLRDGQTVVNERRMVRKDGSRIPVESRTKMLPDGTILSIARDNTDRNRSDELIRQHAYNDPVTGLPNRTLFLDRLEQMIAIAARRGETFGVMLLDVDRFKTINDTLGHRAGDQLLRQVSERLKLCIRQEDTLARIGGDEFTIILSNVGHSSNGAKVARKILETFQKPFEVEDQQIYVTSSIGISLYPFDGLDSQAVLKNADTAMYRAKDQGRDCYRLYTEQMNANAFERLVLDSQLRRALELNEFRLFYQPQISAKTGCIVGVEALIRWQHPDLGLVQPDKFICIAEETGLIDPIGDWVLREACRQGAEWQNRGVPLRVAINLSARQFEQRWLSDTIDGALLESGLAPNLLELELTESTIISNRDNAVETLEALKQLGVKTAVDDFGTGYSSLSYLPKFPLDILKIDRSFISGLVDHRKDSAVVSALINLSHALDMEVVAEGVETKEQLACLRELSCDTIQGFFFSRPIPIAQLEALLKRGAFDVRM